MSEVKLCFICGKPMKKIEVKTARRDCELWACVPCVKEADRKRGKE